MKKENKKEKKYLHNFYTKYANVPIYSCDVMVVVGPREGLAEWVKSGEHVQSQFQDKLIGSIVTAQERGGQLGITFFVGNGGGCIIWMKEFSPSTFIHEISHAAYHILKAKGIMLCEETDEVYAYLVEYLWRTLNPFLSFEAPKIK